VLVAFVGIRVESVVNDGGGILLLKFLHQHFEQQVRVPAVFVRAQRERATKKAFIEGCSVLRFQRVGEVLAASGCGRAVCRDGHYGQENRYSVQMNIYDRAAKNKKNRSALTYFFRRRLWRLGRKGINHGDTEGTEKAGEDEDVEH
jgi:hypothetical protein